ncbi:hypothetical protein [Poseidonibacter lekithochrous]|uniref:hypothetical protein n=1 Tax=Poseidonibacter lekithochrous TaxID=1904463 RepID=UPI0008FC45A9|nr:hypothetical protein [Poseidonibacter lekithochrous]QKJ23241.1 hypothetical protein ALEK_1978 [Poseidonibacter lekithochrous]
MKKFIKISVIASLLATSVYADYKDTKTKVVDKTFNTAGAMLAYTEFELSGEPMAEGLGLDLDTLDPNAINQPTQFDYTAGIESYEYSEEAMYALNYQSKMGPHLVNGLLNAKRGGDMTSLAKRFIKFAQVTGNDPSILPLNMHPTALPYIAGNPELAQKPDMTIVNNDEVVVYKDGKEIVIKTAVPAYLRDYKTLAWQDSGMDKTFNAAAFGAALLKDTMWAQDFLGGMHVIENDEEVEATSSTMDHDGKHALGVSSADGVNGAILTELAWERILFMQEKLGFDGKNLNTKFTPSYDASKPVWFAHKVAVTEGEANGTKSIASLKVTDSKSSLRDTWQVLWPISEFYAYSDQRVNNANQNPAFLSVFDGEPFKNAPKKNTDSNRSNDIKADDAFSVAANVQNLMFENISTIHFDKKAGTLVDTYNGKKGSTVTTYDAAYSIEALRIFQRAIDALPVGYGSADGAKSLESAQGKEALSLIKTQADFLVSKLKGKDGLYANTYDIAKASKSGKSVGTQFAVVRGLTAAYLATKSENYRDEARALVLAIEKNMFDKNIGTYVDASKEYTPYSIAAVSGGLRDAINHLKNEGAEKESALELQNLTQRFTSWFQLVVNGNKLNEGAQLAEWLLDSGEFVKANDLNDSNADGDNVPSIVSAGGENGTAMTMAGKVKLSK